MNTETIPDTVTINKCEYDRLRKAHALLQSLREAGVDNWCGWGEHYDSYQERLRAMNLED